VPRTCRLRIRTGTGYGLRRYAISIEPDQVPGWDVAELNYTETGWWSEHLASFGADVVVLEPSDLRDAVIGQLKGALA
jgi:proteasome accessory factor B